MKPIIIPHYSSVEKVDSLSQAPAQPTATAPAQPKTWGEWAVGNVKSAATAFTNATVNTATFGFADFDTLAGTAKYLMGGQGDLASNIKSSRDATKALYNEHYAASWVGSVPGWIVGGAVSTAAVIYGSTVAAGTGVAIAATRVGLFVGSKVATPVIEFVAPKVVAAASAIAAKAAPLITDAIAKVTSLAAQVVAKPAELVSKVATPVIEAVKPLITNYIVPAIAKYQQGVQSLFHPLHDGAKNFAEATLRKMGIQSGAAATDVTATSTTTARATASTEATVARESTPPRMMQTQPQLQQAKDARGGPNRGSGQVMAPAEAEAIRAEAIKKANQEMEIKAAEVLRREGLITFERNANNSINFDTLKIVQKHKYWGFNNDVAKVLRRFEGVGGDGITLRLEGPKEAWSRLFGLFGQKAAPAETSLAHFRYLSDGETATKAYQAIREGINTLYQNPKYRFVGQRVSNFMLVTEDTMHLALREPWLQSKFGENSLIRMFQREKAGGIFVKIEKDVRDALKLPDLPAEIVEKYRALGQPIPHDVAKGYIPAETRRALLPILEDKQRDVRLIGRDLVQPLDVKGLPSKDINGQPLPPRRVFTEKYQQGWAYKEAKEVPVYGYVKERKLVVGYEADGRTPVFGKAINEAKYEALKAQTLKDAVAEAEAKAMAAELAGQTKAAKQIRASVVGQEAKIIQERLPTLFDETPILTPPIPKAGEVVKTETEKFDMITNRVKNALWEQRSNTSVGPDDMPNPKGVGVWATSAVGRGWDSLVDTVAIPGRLVRNVFSGEQGYILSRAAHVATAYVAYWGIGTLTADQGWVPSYPKMMIESAVGYPTKYPESRLAPPYKCFQNYVEWQFPATVNLGEAEIAKINEAHGKNTSGAEATRQFLEERTKGLIVHECGFPRILPWQTIKREIPDSVPRDNSQAVTRPIQTAPAPTEGNQYPIIREQLKSWVPSSVPDSEISRQAMEACRAKFPGQDQKCQVPSPKL